MRELHARLSHRSGSPGSTRSFYSNKWCTVIYKDEEKRHLCCCCPRGMHRHGNQSEVSFMNSPIKEKASLKSLSPKKRKATKKKLNAKPIDDEVSMEIYVKIMGTRNITTLEVMPTDTLASLKEYIQDTEGISLGQYQFFFAENPLEDKHTLACYKIRHQSTLILKTVQKMQIFVKTSSGKTLDLQVT